MPSPINTRGHTARSQAFISKQAIQSLPSWSLWVRREDSLQGCYCHLTCFLRSKQIGKRKLCLSSDLKDKNQEADIGKRVF